MANIRANVESIGDKVDEIRTRTAEKLESAADTIRDTGCQTASTISDVTKEAGKKLDSSASFVRSCTSGKMFSPLSNAIRKKPFQSLAIATALGLICGFTCRR
jgi:ElaB/YqjD/DUF883 family membrane-anchored ribosome-binding protein